MVVKLRTSNVRVPEGILTSTVSPSRLFNKLRPIGDVVEIRPSCRVGIFACHELIRDFFIFVDVQQLDFRSERYPVPGNLVKIDQRKIRQPLLQLTETDANKILALTRRR